MSYILNRYPGSTRNNGDRIPIIIVIINMIIIRKIRIND